MLKTNIVVPGRFSTFSNIDETSSNMSVFLFIRPPDRMFHFLNKSDGQSSTHFLSFDFVAPGICLTFWIQMMEAHQKHIFFLFRPPLPLAVFKVKSMENQQIYL